MFIAKVMEMEKNLICEIIIYPHTLQINEHYNILA